MIFLISITCFFAVCMCIFQAYYASLWFDMLYKNTPQRLQSFLYKGFATEKKGFSGGAMVRNPSARQETWRTRVWSLGWERFGGLQSIGLQKLDTTEAAEGKTGLVWKRLEISHLKLFSVLLSLNILLRGSKVTNNRNKTQITQCSCKGNWAEWKPELTSSWRTP